MKRVYLYFCLIILTSFMYGCGESIYGDVDNNNSAVSKQDQVDFEFISNNCAPVMAYYESIDSTAKTLSQGDAFKYLCSVLSCGGFNIIGGIDMVAKAGTSDSFGVVASMLGISSVNNEILAGLAPYYDKAVNICEARDNISMLNNTVLDENTASVCGFAGMISSAINVSSLISSITNTDINLSEQGFTDALSQVDVNAAVDKFFANSENEAYTENLTNSINIILESSGSMESLLGGSVSMVNDIKDNLIDETSGKVTSEKLKAYLLSIQNSADNNNSNNGSSNNGSGMNGNSSHGGRNI